MQGGPYFQAPRSDVSRELAGLIEQRAALAERVRDLDRKVTFADDTVSQAKAGLEAIERRRFGGEDVPDAERRKAEAALSKARAASAEPWHERRQGARAALRDADSAIAAHIAENFDALSAELAQDAEAAAERVNAALAEVAAAHREREATAARFTRLIAHVARPQPGLIAWSRADQAARACERVIEQGGEAPPIPKRDPREPTKGEPAQEVAA